MTTTPPSRRSTKAIAITHKLTGGQLLSELRSHDLPSDLADRIGDAIHRRNQLVHHTYEDPRLAKVVGDGEGMKAVVQRVERFALDCAELAVELQLFAVPRLEAMFGTSRAEMIEMVRSIDPSTVDGRRDREQLNALQTFADLEGLAAALDELGGGSPPGDSSQG